jgi:hypothetical protein
MSLAATHIRLALDLKDKYQVQDVKKYISGAIYPDSRYITKINRQLTHNDEILKLTFAKDDFRKGWQTHQACDAIQKEMRKNFLPQAFAEEGDGYNEKIWIIATATKIIQDILDAQSFSIQEYLKYLEFTHNPNGEDIRGIKKYNQLIITLYKGKKETMIEDYYQMWLAFGISKNLGLKVKMKAEELQGNQKLMEKINGAYINMLKNYNNFLKSQ